jgi:hypothetical protein
MTDSGYSLVLLAGLLAGPAAAFLVKPETLIIFLIFPLAGIMTPAGKGMARLLPLLTAPALALAWGLLSGTDVIVERSLRWMAALAAGASMSGALGASRASQILHSISRHVRLRGMVESLALAVSLAGPYSRRVLEVFTLSRREGRSLMDSFASALSSTGTLEDCEEAERTFRSNISLFSAVAAWCLMLCGVMNVI